MWGFSTTRTGEKGMGEGGHNLLWEGQQQHLVLHHEGKQIRCFRFDADGDDIWQSNICYYSQGHINKVHHLIHCILQDSQPRFGGADGVHTMQCALATIRPAREKRSVRIDEINPNYTAYY